MTSCNNCSVYSNTQLASSQYDRSVTILRKMQQIMQSGDSVRGVVEVVDFRVDECVNKRGPFNKDISSACFKASNHNFFKDFLFLFVIEAETDGRNLEMVTSKLSRSGEDVMANALPVIFRMHSPATLSGTNTR